MKNQRPWSWICWGNSQEFLGGASWEKTDAEGKGHSFFRGLEQGCTQHFGSWKTMGIGKENG